MKAFKTVSTESDDLQKVQRNVAEAIGPLLSSQVVDGLLITGVRLESGQLNVVFHGLGRELTGWIVVGQDANAVVWDDQGDNVLKSKTLRLRTTADTIVNLWVF